jgi:hypothetical protein
LKLHISYLQKYFALVLFAVSITFFACNEDVNLKADFKEDYAVYCIINLDSSYQTAIVTRSYEADGFDALSNKTDPSIDNAQIKLTSKSNEFSFLDTSITRTNNFRYDSPQKFYYLNNFQKGNANYLNLAVLLPNGKKLTSGMNIPNYSLYIYKNTFTIPFDSDSTGITIKWNLNNASEGFSFLPRILIYYYNKNDILQILHVLEIPIGYVVQNNLEVPISPKIINENYIRYSKDIVNKAIIKIAEGEERGNLIISHAIFEINVLEENLVRYYSSLNTYKNSYSIKVYEPIITNIEGGYGVFGAFFRKEIPITLDKEFFTFLGFGFVE